MFSGSRIHMVKTGAVNEMTPNKSALQVAGLLSVGVLVTAPIEPATAQWKQYDYATAKLSVAFPSEPEAVPAEDGISFGMQYVDENLGVFYNAQIIGLEAADVAGGSKSMMDSIAQDFGADLKSRKPIRNAGHMGEEFTVAYEEDGIQVVTVVRCFLIGRDLYQVTAAFQAQWRKEARIDQFLASFKLKLPPPKSFRTWKDPTGTYEVVAELVALEDGKVKLLKLDESTAIVPVNRLSKTDREFLRQQFPIQADPNLAAVFTPLSQAKANDAGIRIDGNHYVKSLDAGLLSMDFTFEMLVTITADWKVNGGIALIGIGPADRGGPSGEPSDSAFFRIHGPDQGEGEVQVSNGPNQHLLGHIKNPGTHLVRIIKVDQAVTFAIDVDNDGESPDDLETTIPDIKTFVPSLNEKNTHVFFGGGGTYSKIDLKFAAPKAMAPETRSAAGKPRAYSFGGRRRFPPMFTSIPQIRAGREGIQVTDRHYVRTRSGDYIDKDFVLELLVTVVEDSKGNGGIVFFGFGEGGRDSPYNEPSNTAYIRLHPPDRGKGEVELSNGKGNKQKMGNVPREGTHKLRIVKQGAAVTFAIDVDNDGEGPDDLELSIPDIGAFAPYLHRKNSHLIFGGGGLFREVRLEPLKAGSRTTTDAVPAKGPMKAPQSLPAEFAPNPQLVAVADGLVAERFIRSKQSDFNKRDFVLEVLVRVDSTRDSRQKLHYFGIGEAEQDGPRMPNSAFLQFRAADDTEGRADMMDGRSKRQVGNLKTNGVHLLRITKRGSSLTFTVDQNNDGPTADDIEAKIDDLPSTLSTLHEKNAYLFFGGAGVYQKVELKAVE